MTDDARQHVAELVDEARICMLTTTTEDGQQVSRPMSPQEVEFDGDLWFFTDENSPKVRQVRADPQVNVAFADPKQSQWTSISGRAEVVHDRSRAEELWSPMLKVHADTAEYWETSPGKVVRLIGAARSAATGDRDTFPATNETVDL